LSYFTDYDLKVCIKGGNSKITTSERKRGDRGCEKHLQTWSGKLILEVMITEGNKLKRQNYF
jgi:hypothetical protein